MFSCLISIFQTCNIFFSVSFFLSRIKAQGGQGSYSLLYILHWERFLNYRSLLHCKQILYHLSQQGSLNYFVIKNISVFCKISRHDRGLYFFNRLQISYSFFWYTGTLMGMSIYVYMCVYVIYMISILYIIIYWLLFNHSLSYY